MEDHKTTGGDVTRPTWDATWLAVATTMATRSLCVRDQVGAVIVDARNRVVATGYNGPPTGFPHEDRSCRAWCPRANARVTWTETENSTPISFETSGNEIYDTTGPRRLIENPYHYFTSHGYVKTENVSPCYEDCPALHAEANALSVCDRAQREGGVIYVTSHVCWNCAKLVANSGLVAVVRPVMTALAATHRQPDRSYEFLESCGVDVYTV